MRYSVTVNDFSDKGVEVRHLTGLSLPKAFAIADRHARRGVKLYGGTRVKQNWGMRGGDFPHNYRTTVIRLDRF